MLSIFTSLALEGVHNRLSLFKVLTKAMGMQDAQPTANHQQLPQLMQTMPQVETPQQYNSNVH